jgi:c-di-GMP-binding flagellar brake protein YcgR
MPPFFVSPLLSMQSQLRLETGQTYTVSTVKNTDLYECDALVLDTDCLDLNQRRFPMTKLRVVSEPRRYQRRNAFRVGIMVDIVVRPAGESTNGRKFPGFCEDAQYQ